jgi:hypothetical protein
MRLKDRIPPILLTIHIVVLVMVMLYPGLRFILKPVLMVLVILGVICICLHESNLEVNKNGI